MSNLTRIKNNQITDSTILANTKIVPGSIVGSLFNSNLTVASDVYIAGNLTVQGSSSYLSVASTNTYVNDPLIVLNNAFSGTNNYDIGLLFNRGNQTSAALIWNELSDGFSLIYTTEDGTTYGTINNSGYANIRLGNITVDYAATVTNLSSTGNISAVGATFSGDLALNGGDLTTTATTFNLLNTTATTVNFAGAATSVVAGASTGTFNIRNSLVDVDGNISVDGTMSVTGHVTLEGVTSSGATGTNNLVFSNSPVLTTPNIGTPSYASLDNAIGLPLATGITGFAPNVVTFLATPTSSNLIAAVTDETGSGNLVFSNSPVLTTPNIGTPSYASLDNAIGLPVSTGIAGLATGIATFLATPTSSNLIAAVTDETGSGNLVFDTSPGFTTAITTGSSSFDLLNTTATTVNFAGAATTLAIGADTGTITINNDTVNIEGNVNVNKTTISTSTSSGALVVDGGVGIGETLWVAGNINSTGGNIGGITTIGAPGMAFGVTASGGYGAITSLSADGFKLQSANTDRIIVSTATTSIQNSNFAVGGSFDYTAKLFVDSSTNLVTIAGNIFVKGTALDANVATLSVFDSNVTTATAFSSATSLTLGATSGTASVRNSTLSLPNVTDITVGQTAITLANTTATTVNAFGAATTLNLGATSGTTTIRNNLAAVGVISLVNTTESTDKDSGALVVEGGVGIEKNLSIGGNLNVTKNTNIDSVTPSTNTTSGALVVDGGVGIAGNLNVGENVVITGNLTVQGVTTSLNTSTLDVEDLNITVAKGAGSSAAADGAGLTVDGASATLVYTHATTSWDLNKITKVTDTTNATNTTSGALQIAGGAGIGGSLYARDLQSTVIGNVTPAAAFFTEINASGNVLIGLTQATALNNTPIGNITSSSGAFTTLSASDTTQLGLTTATALNNTPIGNITSSSGAFTTLLASGVTEITNSTAATGVGTGAFRVSGGASINGNLWIGGNINLVGNAYSISGNTGVFYGDLNGFGALYAGVTGYTALPATVFQTTGSYNGYIQNNFQNVNTGAQATTDWVATAGDGSDLDHYIDMGIVTANWDGTQDNSLTNALGANDGYLYVQGNVTTGQGGNLVIGASAPGTKKVSVIVGGNTASSITAVFSNPSTASVSRSTGALVVNGGIGVFGNVSANSITLIDSITATSMSLSGDLALNGGDLTTTATTFNLLNTTATTVNFAGAATTLELGAVSGTTTVKNNLSAGLTFSARDINSSVIGNVTPAAGTFTVLTSQGTTTLGNVTATSINNTVIGNVTPTAATFTNLTAQGTTLTTSLTVSGLANITNNTNSVTYDTGALVVGGGLGVAGNMHLKGGSTIDIGQELSAEIFPQAIARFVSNVDNYSTISIQNVSSNSYASTEFVATADNGTEEVNFITMGIASSQYNGANIGFALPRPLDGYLMLQGDLVGNVYQGGNLLIGTGSFTKDIVFFTDGAVDERVSARIYSEFNNVAILSNRISNASREGALVVSGGAGFRSNVFVRRGALINEGHTTESFTVYGVNGDTLIHTIPEWDSVVIGGSNVAAPLGVTLKVNATNSMMVPVGATAERPSQTGNVDVAGMIRYNSSVAALEFYNGNLWVNAGGDVTFTIITSEQYTGDGANVSYTLSQSTTTAASLVSINGIVQVPTTSYSITGGDTLIFTEAPADGDVIDVRILTTTQTVGGVFSPNGLNSVEPGNDEGVEVSTGTTVGNQTIRIAVTPTGEFAVENGTKVTYDQVAVTTGNPGAASIIDEFPVSSYSTAKYIVQVRNGTSTVESMEALMVSENGNAAVTTYAVISTGAGSLGTLSANVVSGNARLYYSSTSLTGSNVKVYSTYIK